MRMEELWLALYTGEGLGLQGVGVQGVGVLLGKARESGKAL